MRGLDLNLISGLLPWLKPNYYLASRKYPEPEVTHINGYITLHDRPDRNVYPMHSATWSPKFDLRGLWQRGCYPSESCASLRRESSIHPVVLFEGQAWRNNHLT